MKFAKTDNSNMAAKLELRRHFLRTYHAEKPPSVLDCCQGDGHIWRELRREFTVGSYWGVDVKPKKGRLKLDSIRVVSQPGWTQDVIDVDTYGSPWKHWFALLPHVQKPTTVFLTFGQVGFGCVDKGALASLGLRFQRLRLPVSFHGKLRPLYASYCLTKGYDYGLIISEAVEAVAMGNAKYLGVRVEPATADDGGPSSRKKRPRRR